MRAHSLAILVAAVVGGFTLFATPAEAGGRRHYNYYNNDCYRGGYGGGYRGGYGGGYGYYQPRYREDYRPRYYRPVLYVPAPIFQIGFGFGGNGYCR